MLLKHKLTTLLILLLTAPGLYMGSLAETSYKASTYGLERFVERDDRSKLRKAFSELNDGEFIKARYKFQDLSRHNDAVKPFWESAMYLAYAHGDLCQAWWLATINQGFDYTLAQRELQYLMPLDNQAQCIESVAKTLRRTKAPTPTQVTWFWQQVPDAARSFTPTRLTLAQAYRQGFGNEPDLEKSARWYLATLSDHTGLLWTATRDATNALAEILLTLATQQQPSDPSAAHDLYRKSYAFAARASEGDTTGGLFKKRQQDNPLGTKDKDTIIEQVRSCQDKPITQCAFYTVPTGLDLKPLIPQQYPRDRIIHQLLIGNNRTAYEYAKRAVQYQWPLGWTAELYASLLTAQYDQTLFRLSYLSFESNGLDNAFVSAVAAQLSSPQQARQVIMQAAAAVLSSRHVEAATAARAIDYLDRSVKQANAQELLYLSQVFSRPLTPAYNIDKAIHLAVRAFNAQPVLAASAQLARLYRMKNEAQWQDDVDAWRLIAVGLIVDNLAGVLEDVEADQASEKAKQLASECQSAGLRTCDLIDTGLSLYDQAWPARAAFASPTDEGVSLIATLQSALASYIAVNEPERINDLDELMRQHQAPVFVPNIASDMQRLETPSDMAMRYTLLAGALGKSNDWPEALTLQASGLQTLNSSISLTWHMGQAYGQAANDVMLGFPVQNPQLAQLFYEEAVLAGRSRFAQTYADRLRQADGFELDNQRALELYEFAVQQQRKLLIRDLPAYLTAMTDIRDHRTKAYAYALIANQASFGPFISEEDASAYGVDLSADEKVQAQRWADDCMSKDLYLCDLYEPNNKLLFLPIK